MADPGSDENTINTNKQEMLQRMDRRRGRKLKARANSKRTIRTWAEYSGVNLEPTGSYSKYTRWLLVISAFAMIPIFVLLLNLDGMERRFSRGSSAVYHAIGQVSLSIVIMAVGIAGMIVIYTFVSSIIEANRR